jgi:hypothetical protein
MVRSTGVVGLVTFVVLFAAIIAMSLGEPAFTASPEEARAFYLNSTAGWVQAAMAVRVWQRSVGSGSWWDCACCSAGPRGVRHGGPRSPWCVG